MNKGFAFLLLWLGILLIPAPAAQAATFTVNSPADAVDATPGDGVCATSGGVCTLRAAVQETNALPGEDTISLPAGTYTLTIVGANENAAATGDLDITGNLTLNGAGASTTTINGNGTVTGDRVLHVLSPAVATISGVTMSGGRVNGTGGGVHNASHLTLQNCTVTSNTTTGSYNDGGGVYSGLGAVLTVESCTVSSNTGYEGGGIYSYDEITVMGSTITRNTATASSGGGMSLGGGTIQSSAISNNTASSDGGGVYNGYGALTIESSTFTANTTSDSGGGLGNAFGDLTITNSTFLRNRGGTDSYDTGGGLYSRGASATIENSLFALNRAYNGGGLSTYDQFGAEAVVIRNSTFSNNRATGRGGAIHLDENYAASTVALSNVTIYQNTATGSGGGVAEDAYTGVPVEVSARNTLIAGNTNATAPDCQLTLVSQGYNLIGNNTGCTVQSSAGDQIGTAGSPIDPRLEAIANNGGPTYTHALKTDSSAMDAGNPAGCTDENGVLFTADQRGYPRPADGNFDGQAICDIGAYEWSYPDFAVAVTPGWQAICVPAQALFDLDVTSILGYVTPVTLSAAGFPAGTTATFSTNPVTPPGNSTMTIGNTSGAAGGRYEVTVSGVTADRVHTDTVTLDLGTTTPGGVTLSSPADGANGVSTKPAFTWQAAAQGSTYRLEVATDAGFSNVVYTAVVSHTTHTIDTSSLARTTIHYWRVRAENACGVGDYSAAWDFTTGPTGPFVVNSVADAVDANLGDAFCATSAGVCTLRAAVQEANALAGDDTITLPAGLYALTLTGIGEEAAVMGDLDVTGNLTLNGDGSAVTTIEAQWGVTFDTDRVMQVFSPAVVTLYGVTVSGGDVYDPGGGLHNSGTLTLNEVVVSGSTSETDGGGLYSSGTAILNDSAVVNNDAFGDYDGDGGGIYNTGTMTLNHSTVAGNTADGFYGGGTAGGVYNGGALYVINSTFSNNFAWVNDNSGGGYGGAILNRGTLQISNSTIADNTAAISGAGIYQGAAGTTTLRNSVVATNVGNNTHDCGGRPITSAGYNLIGNATGCNFQATTGDQVGTSGNLIDPLLGPLQDNGGATQTHALLTGSPAIDTADPAGCADHQGNLLTVDQRGYLRPADGDGNGSAVCDIGAYEAQAAE
ncbi:MAG: choice-of-anchor Q domain-containing protein [Chloroflexota bacterium]